MFHAILIRDEQTGRGLYLGTSHDSHVTLSCDAAKAFGTRGEALTEIARLKATPMHFLDGSAYSASPCVLPPR